MMAVCAMCGKRIVVHWPQFYVYKRRDKFFCGANCQEVFDVQETRERVGWIEDWERRKAEQSKGQEDRKKMKMFITPENRQKAVEIAIAGGNPLRYLEKCGAKNPSASWSFIKSNVKKNDPELFARIPEKFGLEVDEHGNVVRKEKKGGPSAVPMPGTRVELDPAELEAPAVSKKEIYEALGVPAELGEAEPARVVQDEKGVHLDPGGTLPRVKMEIDAKDLQAATRPEIVPQRIRSEVTEWSGGVTGSRFRVTSLETDLGWYSREADGSVSLVIDGEKTIKLTPKEWKTLLEEAPEALKMLRVNA